jgi:hypothetical protein
MKNLKVGDKLWYTRNDTRWGKDEWLEVTKVGRKLATLSSGYRIDVTDDDGWVDGEGYSSPGRVWRTQEEWHEHVRSQALHDLLRHEVSRFSNKWTVGQFEGALKSLGVEY